MGGSGSGGGGWRGACRMISVARLDIKEGVDGETWKGIVDPAHQLSVDLRLSLNAQVLEVDAITITSINDDLGVRFFVAHETNFAIARLFTVAWHRLHNLSVLDFTNTVHMILVDGITNLPNLNRSFFKGFDCENKVAPLKSIGVSHPKTSAPATGAIPTSSEELWPEEETEERRLQKLKN